MGKRRVVVTGMGIVSPLGHDLAGNWDGIVNGRSGIGMVEGFDASTYPTRIAGEIRIAIDGHHRHAEFRRIHMGQLRDVVRHPALAAPGRQGRVDIIDDSLQIRHAIFPKRKSRQSLGGFSELRKVSTAINASRIRRPGAVP